MNEEKMKVIIGQIEDNEIVIYEFNEHDLNYISEPIEVCDKIVGMEKYDIVGEIRFGEIELYIQKEDEEDFSEFSLVDEEDDTV